MTLEYDNSRPNIIKANRLLQAKAGSGSISQKKIDQMQTLIENNRVDFIPIVLPLLEELSSAIADTRNGKKTDVVGLSALIEPIMQIKANAGMFKYQLVGKLAGIILDFLENVGILNDDVIDLCDTHHKTLSMLIKNHMTGEGGTYGQDLETELKEACRRYANKHGKFQAPETPDAFFVD